MLYRARHDISVNKDVQKLSDIGRKLVKNPSSYDPPSC